jgi:hypothetical protein
MDPPGAKLSSHLIDLIHWVVCTHMSLRPFSPHLSSASAHFNGELFIIACGTHRSQALVFAKRTKQLHPKEFLSSNLDFIQNLDPSI